MSEYFWLALAMLVIGFTIVIAALISIFKQKIYLNEAGHPIATELEIPLLGKMRTNWPAATLVFLGVAVVYMAGNLTKSGMELQRQEAKLITFKGDIAVDTQDLAKMPDTIFVGITSGEWYQPIAKTSTSVSIRVPNSWNAYMAYAFAPNSGNVRPTLIGIPAGKSDFTLELKP